MGRLVIFFFSHLIVKLGALIVVQDTGVGVRGEEWQSGFAVEALQDEQDLSKVERRRL